MTVAKKDARAKHGVLGHINRQLFAHLRIGTKLNIGFGILLVLSLTVIGISYLSSSRATSAMNQTTERRTPTALAAARAQANLLRMLADVRGYLALGDQQYRQGYADAKQAFEADLAELIQRLPPGVAAHDTRLAVLQQARAQWLPLPETLFDLRDDQLEREPALKVLLQEGGPLMAQILVAIKRLLASQSEQPASHNAMQLLTVMSDFQTSFFAMIAGLRGYVSSGRRSFRFEYESNLAINNAALQQLVNASLTDSQQNALSKLLSAHEAFLALPPQMFALVEGEHQREDLYLFRTQAVPPADRMLAQLDAIAASEQALLKQELQAASSQLGTVQKQIIYAALATLLLGIGLAVVLQRNIVGPIRQLNRAAQRLGRGDLNARANVDSNDELGELALTFGQMSDNLRDNLTALEQQRQAVADNLARLERELAAARQLQLSMVPHTFPEVTPAQPVAIHALMEPAREVGGDLYDFFYADDGTLCFLIGDAADKGTTAALFMARTRSLIRLAVAQWRQATGNTPKVEQIMTVVNQELCQDNKTRMFVTLFLGLLNIRDGRLYYANAGHLAPYRLGVTGKVDRLSAELKPDTPLGLNQQRAYHPLEHQLQAGETLFLYTDGIPEATAASDTLFGEQRLQQALARATTASPEQIIQTVKADVDRFVGRADPFDDITMLVLRWSPPQA